MRMLRWSLGMALALSGCGASIHSVPVGIARMPPRAPEGVVLLLSPPSCPYQDVAYVEGESRGDPVDVTLELMRVDAARYGADALVLLQHQDTSSGHGHGTSHGYSATAIVFRDPGCRG